MSDTASLRIGAVQHRMVAHREQNWATTERLLRQLASAGTDIAVLPELHSHEYVGRVMREDMFALSEPIPGPTSEILAYWAATLAMVIVGSVFEKREDGVYHNTALVYDRDGSLAGVYRKMHIPHDPGFYEKFYFTPGEGLPVEQSGEVAGSTVFHPIQTSAGAIGVLVCYDQWFPEAARLMALAGADVLVYPSAIGTVPTESVDVINQERDAWITVQRGHSIANLIPLVATNRVGVERSFDSGDEGIRFWGSSFITGPMGEILAHGSTDREEVILSDISHRQVRELRRQWPFFRDRRPDAYGRILEPWRPGGN
jgi:N-carbamoylputrescine amidase